jgi:hypothetical protein
MDKQDTTTAKLLVNIHGTQKSYFLWNGTESYYKKLRLAYKDISNDKKGDYLYFAFFTLCASTLEYSLNFILTDYCVDKFGPAKYKQFTEGYINLQFGKKLLMTPTIVSEGKLTFNQDHKSYKNLLELISLRNRILHNKDFLKEFDFPKIEKDTKEINFNIKADANHIDTLTKDQCMAFGNSLGDFKNFFMNPAITNDLSKNELIIELK